MSHAEPEPLIPFNEEDAPVNKKVNTKTTLERVSFVLAGFITFGLVMLILLVIVKIGIAIFRI